MKLVAIALLLVMACRRGESVTTLEGYLDLPASLELDQILVLEVRLDAVVVPGSQELPFPREPRRLKTGDTFTLRFADTDIGKQATVRAVGLRNHGRVTDVIEKMAALRQGARVRVTFLFSPSDATDAGPELDARPEPPDGPPPSDVPSPRPETSPDSLPPDSPPPSPPCAPGNICAPIGGSCFYQCAGGGQVGCTCGGTGRWMCGPCGEPPPCSGGGAVQSCPPSSTMCTQYCQGGTSHVCSCASSGGAASCPPCQSCSQGMACAPNGASCQMPCGPGSVTCNCADRLWSCPPCTGGNSCVPSGMCNMPGGSCTYGCPAGGSVVCNCNNGWWSCPPCMQTFCSNTTDCVPGAACSPNQCFCNNPNSGNCAGAGGNWACACFGGTLSCLCCAPGQMCPMGGGQGALCMHRCPSGAFATCSCPPSGGGTWSCSACN